MKLKNTILAIILFTGVAAYSQTTRSEYIKKYQLIAIEEMERTGIPASIKMAQACLESANGNSELSKLSNNHFGIKCKSNWNGKSVSWDDDEKNECFRKYKSVEESYIDHSDFLVGNPRYAALFQLSPTDYAGWATGLKNAGYATAKDYAQRLIKIIEDNQLYLLDSRVTFDQFAHKQIKPAISKVVSNSLTIDPLKSHEVTLRNGLKSVVAREGDTYEMLAEELDMKSWSLNKYNDRPKGYQPMKNEVVYIQAKHRKAQKGKRTHTVEAGETMHYISQMYGIKLNPLYRRNRMKRDEQPRTEEVIYLREKRR